MSPPGARADKPGRWGRSRAHGHGPRLQTPGTGSA
jgi:hypothetical protein